MKNKTKQNKKKNKKKRKIAGNLTIVYVVETYLIAKRGKKKRGQIMLTFTDVPLN